MAIAALWNLGIAQPLLNLLGRQPEFFIAHSAERIDLGIFIILVCLLMPALLYLSTRIFGKYQRGLNTVLIAVLSSVPALLFSPETFIGRRKRADIIWIGGILIAVIGESHGHSMFFLMLVLRYMVLTASASATVAS